MHNIARKILETYLGEKRIPTIEELGLAGSEHEKTKQISFVTLYKNGKVIASSGRIHLKKPNTLFELIENTLFCLKDPRFIEAVKIPEDLKDVQIRIDLINSERGRRVLKNIGELDTKREWLIFLSQTLSKIGVLLPNITNVASTPEEYLEIVCQKAGVDMSTLRPEDSILYAIESTVYGDSETITK